MIIRSVVLSASILMSVGTSQAAIVSNGGFESSLAGWTCVAPDGNCGTGTWFGPTEGVSHFYGFQNSDPKGVLNQSLGTVAGATYSISFMFNSSTDEPVNTLEVDVGDLNEVLNVVVGTWQSFSGMFTAAGAATDLSFLFRTISGSGTLGIDNVAVDRVSTVPVPATWTLVLVALGLAGAARRTKA